MRAFASFVVALCFSVSALAVEPSEMLEDPALEQRARDVSQYLRCVQCQNETIDESDAQIARDMRVLVRQRILDGDSNEEIIDYMVGRYGDYVLLKPRFQPNTIVLWLGPFAILLLGGIIVARRLRTADRTSSVSPLSEEERAEISEVLSRGDDPK